MTKAEKVKSLIEAATELVDDPGDLCYPARDAYGCCLKEDREAPLWTESGLYGRCGKEAARTLLGRRRRVVEALKDLGVKITEEG